MAKRRGRAWVFLVFWIGLTAFLLTYPFNVKNPPQILERGGDKIIHTALFTVMGLAAQAAMPWTSLLVTTPLAVGLEFAQKGIPHRTFDYTDMAANVCGMLLGLVAFELSTRLVK